MNFIFSGRSQAKQLIGSFLLSLICLNSGALFNNQAHAANDFFQNFTMSEAEAWLKTHTFLKCKLQIETGPLPYLFCSHSLNATESLKLTLNYEQTQSKASEMVSLWFIRQNSNYPDDPTRILLPNIWQQDSEQALALIRQALGPEISDDFKQAVLLKQDKAEDGSGSETIWKGKLFSYRVMTQSDEDADFRQDEKGYDPIQGFFYLNPVDRFDYLSENP